MLLLNYINTNNRQKIITSKYYDIQEFQNLKITHKSNAFSLFHINPYSLSKNFDDLQHLLSFTNKNFTETETIVTQSFL